MSSLYKREGSPYFWWGTRYRGRRLHKSTKMRRKHLARRVQEQWDLNLILENLEFLGKSYQKSYRISDYAFEHLIFLEKRKSENTVVIAKGVVKQFNQYAGENELAYLDELTVKSIDGYIDWLQCSPKTKKNHVGVISRMLDQAVREELLQSNPARSATLPQIIKQDRHRLLEQIDLEIIFANAGGWYLYYSFLYYTGLRAGDVAMLKSGNIDHAKRTLTGYIRKSRRFHEFPAHSALLELLTHTEKADKVLFPVLYSEDERKLNSNLAKPRRYLQQLLKAHDRPKATLHSFRHTFNTILRDQGLAIEDRRILLAHASSSTNEIYTHPNLKTALDYVNRVPTFPKPEESN